MNRRVFEVYQYAAPAVLAPLSFWLWWSLYNENIYLTLTAWLLPVLYAYIVPAVGTNVLKVWEFDTRFRIGRFRPQHGFVFGSATSILAWLCHFEQAQTGFELFKYAFILASVLGFWNIIYDIKAIRSGILKVYNQPWANKKDAESITMDYAPWFFAGFGAVYGASIAGAEMLVQSGQFSTGGYVGYFLACLVLCMFIPVVGYRWHSFRMHGHSGCRPIKDNE